MKKNKAAERSTLTPREQLRELLRRAMIAAIKTVEKGCNKSHPFDTADSSAQ